MPKIEIPPIPAPNIDIEGEFNKVVDEGNEMKAEFRRKFGNLDEHFENFVGDADKFFNDLTECFKGGYVILYILY